MIGGTGKLLRHYRHWRRYREIINVLVKEGLSFLVERLGLPGLPLYRRIGKVAGTGREDLSNLPQKLVRVMSELGPTYVKLGQLLSTRSDLLPEEYIREFSKLQDKADAIPYEEVERVILNELGKPVGEIFDWFDRRVSAAASIGQVHRARLRSGQDVVVKVQRPGIEESIRVDLEILEEIGRIIEQRTRLGERYRISEIIEEFSSAILDELDFTLEGRNADIFRKNFKDDPTVYIPKVYWNYTTKKVLVMEYVAGCKLTSRKELRERGFNPSEISRRLVDAMLKQIYFDGFFHSDPHPGNLAVLPGDRVVFMDFGQVGQIDEEIRERAADLVIALVKHDIDGIIKGLLKIGVIQDQPNLSRLRKDLSRLEKKYYRLPFGEINVGTSIKELMDVAGRHQIQFPSELVLAAKALITLEAVIRELAPDMSLVEIAEPFASRVILKRYHPSSIKRHLTENFAKTLAAAAKLPFLAESIAEKINLGQISLRVDNKEFLMLIKALQRSINRLSLSIAFGSILIVGAMLVSINPHSVFLRHHFSDILFVFGLISSLLIPILLAISSKRSN
ncbi:MAG: ABC1 kinase family protein [Thermacetogeniaceae bacterium]